jgi:hypothetical protein
MELRSLDFDLGETAEALRESVRAFAADEIAPRAAEIDRQDDFPADLWRKFGSLGLLGITVEEEYGGAGMGYLEHVIALASAPDAVRGYGPVKMAAFEKFDTQWPQLQARYRGIRKAAPASAKVEKQPAL